MLNLTGFRTPPKGHGACGVVVLALLIAGAACAAPRESGTMIRLPATMAHQIDALLDDAVTPDGPGCVVGVARGTTMLYARARGMASIELEVPLTPETVMDVGSVSKQFTAMILLMLAGERALSLDDDIRSHVPEFPDYGVKITLGHLLHQTSGVRDYANLFGLAGMADETPLTQEDALALVSRQRRLNFAPGTDVMYSNSNYLLLTIAMERVTGHTIDQLYRERLFAPLAMSRTALLGNVETIVRGRASSYSDDGSGRYGARSANGYLRGVGGINTTLGDLSRWMANFDHPRVGDPRLMLQMQQRGVLASGAQIPYAAGLVVDAYRGLSRFTHNGGSAGYRATVTRYPASEISISVLCNTSRAAPHRMSERIADIIFSDQLAPQPREARQDLSRLGGVYYSRDRDEYRILSVLGGNLRLLTAPGNTGRLLSPLGEGRFRPADLGPEILLREDGDGALHLIVPDSLNALVAYHRVGSLGQWRPTDLTAYTGTYFGDDLGATWSVREGKAGLELRRGSADPMGGVEANSVLVPIVPGTFMSTDGIVLNFGDEPGPKVSFSVSSARLVGLSFERAQPS